MPEAPQTDTAPPAAVPPAVPAIRPAAPVSEDLAAGEPAPPAPPAPGAAAAPVPAAEEPAKADEPAGDDVVSKTTDITAGPGGVMTREVGVVTGDLTLRSEFAAGKVTLRVQYKDADEWYVVTGGKAALKDPADLEAVHKIAVGLLNRPEG